MLYVCLMLPPGNGVDQRASQIPSLLRSLLSKEPSVLAIVRAVRIWSDVTQLPWVSEGFTWLQLSYKLSPICGAFRKILLSYLPWTQGAKFPLELSGLEIKETLLKVSFYFFYQINFIDASTSVNVSIPCGFCIHDWMLVPAGMTCIILRDAGCYSLFWRVLTDELISLYCFLSLMAYPANSFSSHFKAACFLTGQRSADGNTLEMLLFLVGRENNDTI